MTMGGRQDVQSLFLLTPTLCSKLIRGCFHLVFSVTQYALRACRCRLIQRADHEASLVGLNLFIILFTPPTQDLILTAPLSHEFARFKERSGLQTAEVQPSAGERALEQWYSFAVPAAAHGRLKDGACLAHQIGLVF